MSPVSSERMIPSRVELKILLSLISLSISSFSAFFWSVITFDIITMDSTSLSEITGPILRRIQFRTPDDESSNTKDWAVLVLIASFTTTLKPSLCGLGTNS